MQEPLRSILSASPLNSSGFARGRWRATLGRAASRTSRIGKARPASTGSHKNLGLLVWAAVESAADERRSTSSGKEMPACLAASGSRLTAVKPGIVLISNRYGANSLSSMMSMRARSRAPMTRLAARARSRQMVATSSGKPRSKRCSAAGRFVLGVEVEKFVLGDDADRSERLIFEQAHGEFRSLDEAFDHGCAGS